MKKVFAYILLTVTFYSFTGCGKDSRSAGIEFAPQMYHSIPLEAYQQTEYNPYSADKKNMREPIQGSIARGKMDFAYPYPNTPEGKELAGKNLKNPIPFTSTSVDQGKALYTLYCSHCHGPNGAGDGEIIKAEKFPNPPAYNSQRIKDLKDGEMFHSITVGINVMGSHASQLTPTERWHVVNYIKKTRGDNTID